MQEMRSASIAFNSEEAEILFQALKIREGELPPAGRAALGRLERFLYDTLSIEDMERLLRDASP